MDSFRSVSKCKNLDLAADAGSNGFNDTATFGSSLVKVPEVGCGNSLSPERNILHGPGLSFGFSSFRSNLDIKPQDNATLGTLLCHIQLMQFLSFREFPTSAPAVTKGFLLTQANRSVSCYSIGRAVQKQSRSCVFTGSTFILNKAKIR